MIHHGIVLALWSALTAAGQVGSTALYTEFETKPAPAVAAALHAEVDSLMALEGVHLEWKSLPATDGSVWMELAVVKFSGRCAALPYANVRFDDSRLGWTHISGGEVLPFAEVDCDAVRTFVLNSLLDIPAARREEVFGRAIGRVTAHELQHIFARTAKHGAHGFDRATLTVGELLADCPPWSGGHDESMLRPGGPGAAAALSGSFQAGRTSYEREGCPLCHGIQGEGSRLGPVLRGAGRSFDSVILAAKLAKSAPKMQRRAHNLKIKPPSVLQEDLPDIARFLTELQDMPPGQ